MAEDAASDGMFPLVTNVVDLSPLELLRIYKRQPMIEARFAQLKTDFEVAPVYLKSVHRIQALLCVYFFALLAEALLERDLRQAVPTRRIEALPLAHGRAGDRPVRAGAAAYAAAPRAARRLTGLPNRNVFNTDSSNS